MLPSGGPFNHQTLLKELCSLPRGSLRSPPNKSPRVKGKLGNTKWGKEPPNSMRGKMRAGWGDSNIFIRMMTRYSLFKRN